MLDDYRVERQWRSNSNVDRERISVDLIIRRCAMM